MPITTDIESLGALPSVRGMDNAPAKFIPPDINFYIVYFIDIQCFLNDS